MLNTDTAHEELKKDITHLSDITDQGCVMKWGNTEALDAQTEEKAFELLCKNADALQLKRLDERLTEAHKRASALLN